LIVALEFVDDWPMSRNEDLGGCVEKCDGLKGRIGRAEAAAMASAAGNATKCGAEKGGGPKQQTLPHMTPYWGFFI